MTTLKLEIVGPAAAALGPAAAKVFSGAGGTIGRLPDNEWVLADPYVSARHARIHWRNGQYLLEDTSSNGVFIGSLDRRLPRGELYPLKSGDRIFIDAYEIRVTLVAAAPDRDATSVLADMFGSSPPRRAPDPIPEDPFGGSDPFRPSKPVSQPGRQSIPGDFTFSDPGAGPAAEATEHADPLKLLGLEAKRTPPPGPRAQDLARHSPLSDHFEPPTAQTTPLKEASAKVIGALIPDGYDPLSDDLAPTPDAFGTRSSPSPRPAPPQRVASSPPAQRSAAPAPPTTPPPAPSRERRSAPPVHASYPTAAPPQAAQPGQLDFAALLAGAGLSGVQVTPEVSEDFGRILRVVVGGLMEALRAREHIKNEFRMRTTTFKASDNNPLKFSASVEDAMHNLLVKRNSAYLGPVEAFEDAFNDVRNHQMAMLAGVRVAFDAMLDQFEPDRLQEAFDRQLKKGSLLAAPARMRYWELYRDKFHDMVKDPETNFRELFGKEFAQAYEKQLKTLKATARAKQK